MTISEAAGLVLLAGAYATGGDVFVLDMGRPVRIRDLAERMIRMSGKTVRDAANPAGEIEIREVGLRPGEKLYEELLIDSAMLTTPNEKILRAQEGFPSQIEVARGLAQLRTAIAAGDNQSVREAIAGVVGAFSGEARIAGMIATPAE
jgi:FlaA1/EpsC-like NDP-sugar epimerase